MTCTNEVPYRKLESLLNFGLHLVYAVYKDKPSSPMIRTLACIPDGQEKSRELVPRT